MAKEEVKEQAPEGQAAAEPKEEKKAEKTKEETPGQAEPKEEKKAEKAAAEPKAEKAKETKEKKKWNPDVAKLGDKIVGLTLLQAKELGDYLKAEYGIEPAAGGAVMVAGPAAPAGEAAKAEEKTSFDVILKEFGDKKIQVIKEVRALTGLGLKEAKDLVDGVPKPVKQGISKTEAEAAKKQLESAGAVVELV